MNDHSISETCPGKPQVILFVALSIVSGWPLVPEHELPESSFPLKQMTRVLNRGPSLADASAAMQSSLISETPKNTRNIIFIATWVQPIQRRVLQSWQNDHR